MCVSDRFFFFICWTTYVYVFDREFPKTSIKTYHWPVLILFHKFIVIVLFLILDSVWHFAFAIQFGYVFWFRRQSIRFNGLKGDRILSFFFYFINIYDIYYQGLTTHSIWLWRLRVCVFLFWSIFWHFVQYPQHTPQLRLVGMHNRHTAVNIFIWFFFPFDYF